MGFVHVVVLMAAWSGVQAATCVGDNCRSGDKAPSLLQRSVRDSMTTVDADELEERGEQMQMRRQHEEEQGHAKKTHGTAMSVLMSGKRVYNFHRRFMQAGKGRLGEGITDWLLFFKEGVDDSTIHAICEQIEQETGHPCLHEGHPSKGGIAFVDFQGTDEELKEVMANPMIDFAEPDFVVSAIPELGSTAETSVWGIDRVDDRSGLDGSYQSGLDLTGEGVHVYVADTGVFTQHEEFEGRAVATLDMTTSEGRLVCVDENCAKDAHGHGTHCAGTVASKTYGIAKKAVIHSVKVLGDDGSGSFAWIADAVDWISSDGARPAVVSMSLGGSGVSKSFETTVNKATDNGLTIVVAAGNDNDDACGYTPAFVPRAITVGSTTKHHDARSWFSNYGSCLDIYAPGSSILSTGKTAGGTATKSGTSMACPHVAGAAALALELLPSLNGDEVSQVLSQWSTGGKVGDAKEGSPNRLLYVGDQITTPGPLPEPSPNPTTVPTPKPTPSPTPPTPVPTPKPTPPPTAPTPVPSGYVDVGSGACTGSGQYLFSKSDSSQCAAYCDTKADCGGYSFRGDSGRCRWVPKQDQVSGGYFKWGDARCYAKVIATTPSPSASPTPRPTASTSPKPTVSPTPLPTSSPTRSPTPWPTASPSPQPTVSPTPLPTSSPTRSPTPWPTASPSTQPTQLPKPPPASSSPEDLPNGSFEGNGSELHIDSIGNSTVIAYAGKNGTNFEVKLPGRFKKA